VTPKYRIVSKWALRLFVLVSFFHIFSGHVCYCIVGETFTIMVVSIASHFRWNVSLYYCTS